MPSNNLPTEIMLARVQKSADLAREVGYGALTGSDAFWAIETVARLKEELARVTAERDKLLGAHWRIKAEAGRVCGQFENCRHAACQSSYHAWSIADAALKGETVEEANERAIREFNAATNETNE